MSAQGATLKRGTVHLPVWPVAVLIAGVGAFMIVTSLIDDRPEGSVTSVTQTERLANSSAAIREQGAILPAAPAINPIVFENSAAAVREQGATLGFQEQAVGISHVTPLPRMVVGLENPGAYVQGVNYVPGLENAGAYTQGVNYIPGLENPGAAPFVDAAGDGFTPTLGSRPGMTGGQICGQCR